MNFDSVKDYLQIEETVFSKTFELPLEFEKILSDGLPSVGRVLKAIGEPLISSKQINGKNCSIDGNCLITVIYVSETGALCSYADNIPFSKNFELENECEDAYVEIDSICDNISCRAITGRRLELNCNAILNVSVNNVCKKEIVTGCDCSSIQLKLESTNVTTCVGRSDKNVIIEEELQISDSETVTSCLRCSVTPRITDNRVVSGKVMAKGEVEIKMLCLCKDGAAKEFSSIIPFSQMMEIENCDECDCESKATLCGYEFRERSGSDGSFASVIFSARINILTKCFKTVNQCFVEDAYSVAGELRNESCNINFSKNIGVINDRFSFSKELEFTEGTLEAIKDFWCETQKYNYCIENNELIISGNIKICILGYDSSGAAVFNERPADYEYRYPLKELLGDKPCCVDIKVKSCDYSFYDSDKLAAKIELEVSAKLVNRKKSTVLKHLEMSDDKTDTCSKNKGAAMYVYFASKGESVWDIAKKYRSEIKCVKETNCIEDDEICEDTKLIIPV